MTFDKVVKLIAGAGLFGAWLALVILKMVPAAEFVNALQLALMALGIYHASTSGATPAPEANSTVVISKSDQAESPQP